MTTGTPRPTELPLVGFLSILRRRVRTVLAVTVLAVIGVSVLSALVTPQYLARSSVVLTVEYDSNGRYLLGSQEFAQGLVTNCMAVITRSAVLGEALTRTGARLDTDELADETQVRSAPGSDVIEVRVTDPSPDRAARLANAVAAAGTPACENLRPDAPPLVSVFRFHPGASASTPQADVQPRWTLNLVMGAVLGSAAGVVAALTLENLAGGLRAPLPRGRAYRKPTGSRGRRDRS